MLNASKTYELNILVSGKPVTEYNHKSNIFIEGRKGSEFELEFKNKTNKKVLVVPSVDGKSVFDGKPATAESRGYVVNAWASVRIPGWTLDNKDVAKFTFEDKEKSYSSQMAEPGEAVITGVIGVLVYSEKEVPRPVVHQVHHHYTYTPSIATWPHTSSWPSTTTPWWNSALGGTVSVNNVVDPLSTDLGSYAKGTATRSMLSATATSTISDSSTSLENSFSMGAGFGERAEFKTHDVTFERGTVVATLELYYDSRRNLEKRGIQVVRRETRHLDELPRAFSGLGCQPPKGWQG